MNVLIVDKLSSEVVSALQNLGLEVEVRDDLKAETLPQAVGVADILVVRSTKVTAATIQAAPRLSLIIRAGAQRKSVQRVHQFHDLGDRRIEMKRSFKILRDPVDRFMGFAE